MSLSKLCKLCLFTLAVILSGFAAVETLSVQIMEYEAPTPNSRPHDPAIAPDGSLWYTGQAANRGQSGANKGFPEF